MLWSDGLKMSGELCTPCAWHFHRPQLRTGYCDSAKKPYRDLLEPNVLKGPYECLTRVYSRTLPVDDAEPENGWGPPLHSNFGQL